MNTNVSVNRKAPNSDLWTLERHVANKSKSRTNLTTIELLISAGEYAVYIMSFFILFAIKVVPEYHGSVMLWTWPTKIAIFKDYVWFLGVFLGLYLLGTYQRHFYRFDRESNISDEIIVIIRTALVSFMITIGITFLIKNTMVYSRVLLLIFVTILMIEAILFRYIRKRLYYQLKKKGILKQNIIIIGAGRVGRQLQKLFSHSSMNGYELVGLLDDDKIDEHILGNVNDLEQIIYTHKIDILYVTIPSERKRINELLQRIYKYPIEIRIIPELYDRISSVYEYRQDFGYPCLQIVKTPLQGLNLLVKRVMDIGLSLFGLISLSPLFLCLAILIRLDSKGPVFFKQKRIGKNGIQFLMYKFRSMYINAEEEREKLLARNEAEGPVFKIKEDPRITKVGKFIRKYSLDEFPQLINVLFGHMSLIGPRPPLPEEVSLYSDEYWRRLDVRPGMTGLWQVSGRSDLTFQEWVQLDIQYIERWSFALELKILIKTIPVVLKGNGAY